MIVDLKDGKAVIAEGVKDLAIVKNLLNRDKTKNKSSFEIWMRFCYHAYDKRSVYWNYLPDEREKKVVEMVFPDKSVTYFKQIVGLKSFIDFYINTTYSFKEKLYRRLLKDVEDMMDHISRIELQKKIRVKKNIEIDYFCKETGKKESQSVPVDTRITIDNTDEKVKSMEVLDKLLKREETMRKAIEREKIAEEMKKNTAQRLFDR